MPAATPSQIKPRIALTVGDPAGIGPELIVRLLSSPDIAARAHVTLIGNRPGLERAARAAKVAMPTESDWLSIAEWPGMDLDFEPSVAAVENGRFILDSLSFGTRLVSAGPRRRAVFCAFEQGRDAQGRHARGRRNALVCQANAVRRCVRRIQYPWATCGLPA